MMDAYDNKTIFQFTGAEYASWALKVQYGLFQKRLIHTVMDFKGQRRITCPARIPPMAQGALALITTANARTTTRNAHAVQIINRDEEIHKWIEKDLDAQAFLVQYIGTRQHTHIRNCDTSYEMWESLKAFYQLKGDVEIANANALFFAIVMHESEEISPYVQRL